MLENDTVREWDGAGRPEADRPRDGEEIATKPDGTPVHWYEDSLAVPGMDGEIEALPLYAGQSAGATGAIQPTGELVKTLCAETVTAIEETASVVSAKS